MAEQTWAHNFCSMDSCGSCCGAFWCSSCLYGRTSWRLKQFPQSPDTSNGFEWCNVPCIGMLAGWCLFVPCIPIWIQRNSVRGRFNIAGNDCTDLLTSTFCGCCAQAQLENELKDRAEKELLMVNYPPPAQERMVYAEPSSLQPRAVQDAPPPDYKSS
ncbi:hypothetical protein E4T42_04803 [Aureobasidium subglaciale]|nr:hypothetical protein E4T42_04803 [Aureobasidium subglaciale]